MTDDTILYTRRLGHGPDVRVRRTSALGDMPVVAVLEVDRRTGTARALGEFPPPLMTAEGESEDAVLATLEPHARDDRSVAGLMHEKQQR